MKRKATILATVWATLLAAPCALQAQAIDEGDLAKRLLGTWRMVAHRYGDAEEFTPIPKEKQTTLKHFVPTVTAWAEWEPETGKVIHCAGGSWSTQGDQFTEKPAYGMGRKFDAIRGKEMTFTAKIDGDRWTQSGELDGFKLAEVWERVPGEESDDGELAGKLTGIWRLGAFKYDIPREVVETPDVPKEGQATVKLVTPTHFIWITGDLQTHKVTRCAGGTWCVKAGNCVERVQYGLVGGFELLRNQELTYQCRLDADRWEHTAEPGDGVRLAETWERVKPEP